MTYEEIRRYAILCGDFHPATDASLSDLVTAIKRKPYAFPPNLAEAMALHIEEQRLASQPKSSESP